MSRTISRRTILRGIGATLALPLLEAMSPAVARAATGAAAKAAPRRMVFCYVPNGMHMPDWTPSADGAKFEFTPTLKPLENVRSELTVLTGLTLNGARALGDGGGDHARSVAAFLTGAHPKKTDGANIQNDISIDQYAVQKIGDKTRFASLELGSEPSAQSGNCDSGYSCAYSSNMSWRNPTTPVPKEVNPRAVFDRLFGGEGTEAKAASNRREKYRKSVLDFVKEDASALQRKLGVADQRKMEEYLYAVRDIERRVYGVEKLDRPEEFVPDYPRPAGVPRDYAEHLRLMFDLMQLALQSDSTRIITFMYTNDSSNRSYQNLGVFEGHHELSHHGKNAEKQAKISKINHYHMQQFAYFAEKLAKTKEGEGSLLDNCMVMYGSGISDGDRHNHNDLPILMLGRGGGTIKPGRHIRYPNDTPLTNLYVSMLDRMGVKVDHFGDSTEALKGLEG